MKKVWFVSGVAAALGIVFMIAGLSMGAKKWVYVDFAGIHVVDTKNDQSKTEFKEISLEEYEHIDVDVTSYRVELFQAEHYGFEFINNNDTEITWSVDNNTLKINEKLVGENGFRLFNLDLRFPWNYEASALKIYIPKNAVLKNVNIKAISGNIIIQDITCSSLNLQEASGNTEIADSTIGQLVSTRISGNLSIDNCTIEDSQIKVGSGNTEISKIKSKGLSINCISGSINVNGELSGDTVIHSTSGGVKMQLSGKEGDYNKSFHSTSGGVYINNKKAKGGYSDQPGAGDNIKIDTVSGSIHADFTN